MMKNFTAEAQRAQSDFFFCLTGDGVRQKDAHDINPRLQPGLLTRKSYVHMSVSQRLNLAKREIFRMAED
ncbi:MAG: hypothetical protein CVU57_31105 [Deltaproteobacteria bacterium HGW-Deltaproteobacteria-15]|nr:MAG: hypothetical protein CVU57_31105 [Deltaproteobacteria bacterium HGW-Deltaproteobacteria-15]